MPQIERNIAAVFLVFVGIFVNQFSLPLAIAILVAAILVHRGYQMSDLRVNVQNSNRVQTLASSLYTWTGHAVSAIAEKCRVLTNSENRVSTQNVSSPLESDVRQEYYPDAENIYNRENIFKGNNLTRKVSYQLPEKSSPYSSAIPGRQTTSPIPTSVTYSERFSNAHLRTSEMESLSPRDSPWGYSLSPQQRSPVAEVKPVQAIAGPLLASAKYNTKRNPNPYVDASSPGFSSRLLKYADAATHQPQYTRPGKLPLVHLNRSPMPTLSPHNSRKVQVPVRLRIAPSSYDVPESSPFSRNDHQQELENQSKSVVDALKEISRKRFRSEDVVSDPKRHHRSDSSSSSSSSSSPAFGNEMSYDQTPSGKRPREEESPKLQKKNVKRIRSNEIFSSLSSSRNICVGKKRKAADNLSRSNTPSPVGKLLKKSPRFIPIGTSEGRDLKSSEHISLQQEPEPKPYEPIIRNEKGTGFRPLPSQHISQEAVREQKSSTSQSEEHQREEDKESRIQPPKSQYGRLFSKTLAKGAPVQQESAKEKNGGKNPWTPRTTVDIDAITEEDILSEDFTHGSHRLKSMLSVISSAGNASSNSSKNDMLDGNLIKQSSSKLSDDNKETKLSASTSETDKQSMSDSAKILPDKTLVPATPTVTEIIPPRSISSTSQVTLPKPELVTAASADVSSSTLSPVLSVFKTSASTPTSFTVTSIKQASVDTSLRTPVTSVPSVSSPATSSVFSLPQTPVSIPTTSQVTLSNLSSSSLQTQPSALLTESSRSFVSVTAASSMFGAPQLGEKQPVSSSPSFSFGANAASNVQASSNPKPVFPLPISNAAATSTVSSTLQPTISSPILVTSTSSPTSSSTAVTIKPASSTVSSGAFMFGTAPAVTSSSIEFPKTTSSVISFGGINTPTTEVTSSQAVAPSLVGGKNTTSAAMDANTKSTFTFGTLPTSSAPVPVTTSSGGFHFQFGPGTQAPVIAPKPQEVGSGFNFSFVPNKESTPLSQPSAPSLPKPPTFGGGFNFGATSSANPQENKTMTFGSTGSINPAPTPASGGFNMSANNDPASNIQKPAFGLGPAGPSAAPSNPLTSGGFNFGVKPAESAPMAPSAPNVAAPFQFGSTPTAPVHPVQQQQASAMGSPFSIGGTSEQKPMEERYIFGSVQSTNTATTLQANPPTFEQPGLPMFNSPNVNPTQNPVPASSSLFQFSSTGGVAQTGMFSGGCSFGVRPPTLATPGFNPTGPSASAPFQFGATPSAPMFSIGSGSTAPRSRPRNRRQK